MLEDSRLAQAEPEFFLIWLADQYPDDPQIERWCEIESRQVETGEETVARLREFFPLEGKRVLDIGCQWGATCIALAKAGASVCGVDIRDEFVRGARVRATNWGADVKYATGSAEAIPFASASFDVALCNNVIEHVASHSEAVSELARVIAPGGMLYLNGPNRLSPKFLRADPHYQMAGVSLLPHQLGAWYVMKVRRYPAYDVGVFPVPAKVKRLLERGGFEIVQSSRSRGALRFHLGGMFWFVARRR